MKLRLILAKTDKLDLALQRYAEFLGEAEAHRVLADHYTTAVLDVDPNTNWWRFAELKQKQHEHQTSHTPYMQRAEQARETMEKQ